MSAGRVSFADLMPAERACCGTFVGSAHRLTCRALQRDELMRQACQRAIDLAAQGQHVSPVHLAFARKWVAEHAPLGRPLGTGEPT